MDEFESDPDSYEPLDFDMTLALKLLQDFALGLDSQTVQLRLEDGSTAAFTWGSSLTIANASSHDANHDGVIDFDFEFAPAVTLTNNTDIGVDFSAKLTLLKNADPIGPYVFDLPILNSERIDVYNNTFALGGIQSEAYSFFV